MHKWIIVFLTSMHFCYAQKSDFNHISFEKADNIAKKTKAKKLLQLNKLTIDLTQYLPTDIEKVRAIYKWICTNVASDFSLYQKNERKRKKYEKDSVKLEAWNSELKKTLFKKLLNKKQTICTGYAYLFKEMCDIAGIKSKMIYGFGRTRESLTFEPNYPNHTWNAVYVNNKWYLCDPTWSAGIAYAEGNSFKFNYNDGYFLTEPSLFILNHFPLTKEDSLLESPLSFEEFMQVPLLYGAAYQLMDTHLLPTKMHHELKVNQTLNIAYQLAKPIEKENVYVMLTTTTTKKIIPKIEFENNVLNLSHTFTKVDFYDLHVYINNEIIATYTVNVTL